MSFESSAPCHFANVCFLGAIFFLFGALFLFPPSASVFVTISLSFLVVSFLPERSDVLFLTTIPLPLLGPFRCRWWNIEEGAPRRFPPSRPTYNTLPHPTNNTKEYRDPLRAEVLFVRFSRFVLFPLSSPSFPLLFLCFHFPFRVCQSVRCEWPLEDLFFSFSLW